MSGTKTLAAPVPPGGTIGILGGGQLGRMLSLAAARLGLKTRVFCDNPASPAFQVCDGHTVGKFDDADAVAAFARDCDAVTFEFENVPAATVARIAQPSCRKSLRQGAAGDAGPGRRRKTSCAMPGSRPRAISA